MDLTQRFAAALPTVDATRAGLVAADLLRRWGEPQRHYHTVRHLEVVLDIVDQFGVSATRLDVVRLAGWYHDAIYDPRSSDNERRSADLAMTQLGSLERPPDEVDAVIRLVLLTATHRPATDDRDGQLLCDADLAILGAEPADYDGYAVAIRAEYAHVASDAFQAGRSEILTRLLSAPFIYHLPALRERYEAPARANVARELAELARADF